MEALGLGILFFLAALNLIFVFTQTGWWPLNLLAAIACAFSAYKIISGG